MKVKYMKQCQSFNCLICNAKISQLYKDNRRIERLSDHTAMMFGHGIVSAIHGGYGSQHDLNTYVICFCDNCITKLVEEKKILLSHCYL